jgi:glycerol-3-phosphate cytidylyltransferase
MIDIPNRQNLTVGITAGAFDLCHAGHHLMFRDAKKHCDYLIVAIQIDPSADRPSKNKPVQSIVERQIQVASSRYVDHTIVYHTEKDLHDLLLCLDYDVRILGDEYKTKHFTGKDISGHMDKCVFNDREHSFSSSSLRKRVYDEEKKSH